MLLSALLPNGHAHSTCMAADAFGAVRNDQGLDIPALRRHLTGGGKLQDFPGGEQCLHCWVGAVMCSLSGLCIPGLKHDHEDCHVPKLAL